MSAAKPVAAASSAKGDAKAVAATDLDGLPLDLALQLTQGADTPASAAADAKGAAPAGAATYVQPSADAIEGVRAALEAKLVANKKEKDVGKPGAAIKEYKAPLPAPILGKKRPDVVLLFLGPPSDTARDTATTSAWDPFQRAPGVWCKSIGEQLVAFLKHGGLEFTDYTRMDLYCNKAWLPKNKTTFSIDGENSDLAFAKNLWASYSAILRPKTVFAFGTSGWPITEQIGIFPSATKLCTGSRAHRCKKITIAHLKGHGDFGFPSAHADMKPYKCGEITYVWVQHPFSLASRHRAKGGRRSSLSI